MRQTDNGFDLIVVGGSGVLEVLGAAGSSFDSFTGFEDTAGLRSIPIQNRGGPTAVGRRVGNYSFDNVTSGSVTATLVLWLLGPGLLLVVRCVRIAPVPAVRGRA